MNDFDFKSILFSAKKIDWFKMSSGMFDRIENSRDFDPNALLIADKSTFGLYKTNLKKHKNNIN